MDGLGVTLVNSIVGLGVTDPFVGKLVTVKADGLSVLIVKSTVGSFVVILTVGDVV